MVRDGSLTVTGEASWPVVSRGRGAAGRPSPPRAVCPECPWCSQAAGTDSRLPEASHAPREEGSAVPGPEPRHDRTAQHGSGSWQPRGPTLRQLLRGHKRTPVRGW